MYATRDDMVKRFGEKEVSVLTDRNYSGQIDEEAVRAMLGRLDLQEASVTARMESRL